MCVTPVCQCLDDCVASRMLWWPVVSRSLLSRGWVDKLTSVFSWFSEPFREAQPEEQAPANPIEGEEKKVGT